MRWFVVLPWLLVAAIGSVQAQPSVSKNEMDIAAQQRRLDAQRSDLARQTQEEESACNSRFAVNDCLKAVRLRSLERNADIRRQQASLNDIQRQRDGQEKIRQLEEKKLQHEQGLRDAAARSNESPGLETQGKNADQRQVQQGNERSQASNRIADRDAVRPQPAVSAESQQMYQRKLQEAERRRQERDKRIAEKAGGKRLAPLPAAP